MNDARTPREAKQQLMDDLIAEWRTIPIVYHSDHTPKAVAEMMTKLNRRVVSAVAQKHGLKVPKFSPDYGTELSS